MPGDLGAASTPTTQLAKEQDGKRSRTDSVGVVVAVDTDPRSCLDGGGDLLDSRVHVAESERVVARKRPVEEPPSILGRRIPSSNQYRRSYLVHRELGGQCAHLGIGTRLEFPGSGRHREPDGTDA